MAEERERVARGELTRWLLMGLLIAVGLGLYLVVGVEIEPVARPAVLEDAP
jgi:hypothetical protein